MHSTEDSSRSPLCGQWLLAPPALRICSWLCSGSPAGKHHTFRARSSLRLLPYPPPSLQARSEDISPVPRLHNLRGRLFVHSLIQHIFLKMCQACHREQDRQFLPSQNLQSLSGTHQMGREEESGLLNLF